MITARADGLRRTGGWRLDYKEEKVLTMVVGTLPASTVWMDELFIWTAVVAILLLHHRVVVLFFSGLATTTCNHEPTTSLQSRDQ